MIKGLALSVAAFASANATAADAATYVFSLKSSQYNATFELPDSPSVGSCYVAGSYFCFDGVQGTLNNAAHTFDGLIFTSTNYFAGGNGGFSYDADFSQYFVGTQLYTGSESSPTFKLGSFNLTAFTNPSVTGTLTISNPTSGVPEPATWAMMLLGFGAVGGAMRRRRQKITVSYA